MLVGRCHTIVPPGKIDSLSDATFLVKAIAGGAIGHLGLAGRNGWISAVAEAPIFCHGQPPN